MHVPQIDLNLLSTLAMLLKTCSVSETARRLGTSQPSVSRSLAELRRIVGDPLLVRVGNRMCRTRRAEGLLAPLSEWVGSAATLLDTPQFEPATLRRRFRVASTDFGVLSVIAPALPAIIQAAPHVAVDVMPLPFEPAAPLADGTLDLAVSGLDYNPAQLHGRALFSDPFAHLMRPQHSLAGPSTPLTIRELLDCAHVGITVSDAEVERIHLMLGEGAGDRKVSATLPYFHAAPQLLQSSDLVMTLPMRAARSFSALHGLAYRPAPAEIGTLHYVLLWHGRSANDPAVAWLGEMLASACHASGE